MRVILFLASLLSLMSAVSVLVSAQSSIHEIAGFSLLIVTVILFSGAAVVDALVQNKKQLQLLRKEIKEIETHRLKSTLKDELQ